MTNDKTDLGLRRFTLDDQRRFGFASHDLNPMHVDAVAARRLITGRAVVHGMHTLLTALERLHVDNLPQGSVSIDCRFIQPVNVDEVVHLFQSIDADGSITLDAEVNSVLCMRARVSAPIPQHRIDLAIPPTGITLHPVALPDDRPAAEHSGACYELPDWGAALAPMFPKATARFGAAMVGALGGLSYMVGMVCPGLHSVFSSVKLTTTGAASGERLRVHVVRHEPRFGMLTMVFGGPVSGELTAFERARPQAQPQMSELVERVAKARFAATCAWVIGGSRGLGELAAKLLAAGGADVTLTYAHGRDDAEGVVREIRNQQRGTAQALRCDLGGEDGLGALMASGVPDAVYYFATPRIARKAAGVFDRLAFNEFVDFYLDRFAGLCLALESAASTPVTVYLPSTEFIDQRPKGMTAYAMAKAAAEILADDLNRSLRHVRIVHTRLPRLATDQTAGLKGLDRWANTNAILGVLDATLGPPRDHADAAPAA